MAASGSGEEPGERPWTATSTWAPAPGGGAVEDAVSFETTDFDAEAVPAGVVLSRPSPDGDIPPCEVTVSFRGKYEIHRVYVRSTARIYEIYHSTDTKGTSKDYLCTVRCGLAVKEPQLSGEESMAQLSGNASTTEKRECGKSVSSSSSDEDSWVDVKIPESLVGNNTSESQERNVARTSQENTLAHYEATAEMTDVTPCVSLTIRLLSLQSKTSVHIQEIYIFADPVESTNDDSVTGPGNMGGSSLLAMLVPGLMQMRSRNLKIDDKYFSDGSRTQLTQDRATKESSTCEMVVPEAGSCRTNDSRYEPAGIESGIGINPKDGGTVSSEKSEKVEFQFKDPKSLASHLQTMENTHVPSVNGLGVSNTDQLANPLMNENYTHNNIERKLDILLSKVDNMELYCSRFEDIMIKPLSSIEARLQRLEQQFDSFSVEIQSIRDSSTRMAAPDDLLDMTNSQGKAHNDGNTGTPSVTDRKPGLAIRVPEFSSEDPCGYLASNENQGNFRGPNVVPRLLVKVPDFIAQPELTGEKLCDGPLSPVEHAQSSEKGRKISPGLVVKVPEFPDDEDDDEVEEEKEAEVSDDDDGQRQCDDTLNKNTVDNSKNKKPVSINGALASALEALLTSTKGMPSSKSILCTATNLSAENTNDSSSCSLSPKKIDETSTKDGMAGQFLATSGNANLDGTSVSYQEIDVAPHTSLPNAILDGKFEVNEQYNDLNSDKVAFVGSTESLDSQRDTVDESFDDASEGQNNCFTLETIPFVASTGPLDPPKPPTGSEAVDDGVLVNENRPAISLAEFLAARNANSCKNGTSVVCCGSGGAEKLSFGRTMAGAGKMSKNISLLLVKKALEVDADDTDHFCSVPTAANFERSCSAALRNSVNGHNINTKEAVSDKDCDLENTESNFRLFVGMNSVSSQYSAADSNEKWIQNRRSDWRLDESFLKPNAEDPLSSVSSMESFSGAPAKEPVVSASTTSSNYTKDLAGIGVCSTATPIAGEELQKVCDLLYEYKDDMLGMAFAAKGTNKSGPSLEVLLGESSDSEEQVSDLEDVDNSGGMGSAQLFSTLSSDDGASAAEGPLVDVADLTTPAEAYTCALNEPLVDVAGLTNPPDVNEPFADLVDVPNPSEAYVSPSQCLFTWEPLAGADDMPKPLEAGGSSGEHSDSLI